MGTIETVIQKNIATVTFYHPSSNSFPSNLLQQLTDEFNALGKNNSISIIVLKSAGDGAFCAGASFDELLSISNYEEGSRFFSGFANVINAMRKCPKLIIGRIHGKAVGGGVGLAASCDYTFAKKESAVKLSEIAIGIGPFVIEPAVTRKIGKIAMSEMTLNPTVWKSGEWALEKGLYTEIFDSTEELDNRLDNYIKEISGYNKEALLEIKKILWEGTDYWDTLLYERAAISGRLVLSDFTKTALEKFKK
ncbi:enoyl-CoA hydratase/isomerase family protein [Flavobacterium sp. HXWNR69]|uniref:Enoyl-CoA hydratase/isomerase family protein n=1 Tax=Flavobacterium fragile TaxID=2949085 RepID=A0ABT0TI24_9FLAO|nr:enoyl-CoA hydratase/isomerase family protein [Flavobacterium sp. HXWNR69]MCL9770630.1 enoyl-CoA hydratase/isomerase family protein [Flavobacterium sp. HXWNR69]